MKLILTGGLGYIGLHILHYLNKFDEIIIIDDYSNSTEKSLLYAQSVQKIKFINKKISDVSIGEIPEGDYKCIHLASSKYVDESYTVPLHYYENNVYEFICLLKLLKQIKCSALIFSSTAAIYKPSNKPVNEVDGVNHLSLMSPYAQTKYICENILKYVNDLDVTILRYFNPIGFLNKNIFDLMEKKDGGLFNNICCSVINKKDFDIYGGDYETHDGTPIRDFIDIEDLASVHVKMLCNKGFNVINVGTGDKTSVLDIIKLFGLKYSIKQRRNGDIPCSCADVTFLNQMGFSTKNTMPYTINKVKKYLNM